jgi:hypothetical protein
VIAEDMNEIARQEKTLSVEKLKVSQLDCVRPHGMSWANQIRDA